MARYFPILTRARRAQWRDGRAFVGLGILVSAVATLLAWRYGSVVSEISGVEAQAKLREVGETLWRQSASLQLLLALLLAPALTAGAIAGERERGLLEGLQLAPLSPLQIVGEKWASALFPMLLILGALFPFNLMLVMSGGASFEDLLLLVTWSLACAGGGAAIGIACSAWARRTHLAMRSAYGFVILWMISSGAAAFAANESSIPSFGGGFTVPNYVKWWGRANPLFAANDLFANANFPAKWPVAALFLASVTILGLWLATRALRFPLGEAPFIETKRAPKTASPLGHFEVPFAGDLRFDNPVMGREVRAKFRLRQPPLAVIIAEGILALLVAFFYARTVGVALVDASDRPIIFWGVSFTGLIVTLISCGIMGANSFAREHEDGGWDGLRLSLLRPRDLVCGKYGGIVLTCALFSLPVWPLLLPCVSWRAWVLPVPYSGQIALSQLVAVVVVWIASMSAATLWGLWLGQRARRSSSAVAWTLGTGALWLIGLPILSAWTQNNGISWAAFHPFLALARASAAWPINLSVALAAPFLVAMLGISAVLWIGLEWEIKREFGE